MLFIDTQSESLHSSVSETTYILRILFKFFSALPELVHKSSFALRVITSLFWSAVFNRDSSGLNAVGFLKYLNTHEEGGQCI